MSVFSNLKESFLRAAVQAGRARARQELLAMSDRQLSDCGFSKPLLRQGVQAWPWRLENSPEAATLVMPAAVTRRAIQPVQAHSEHRAIRQAVRELGQYTDRELSDLGLSRAGIEQAVRVGRTELEQSIGHRNAA